MPIPHHIQPHIPYRIKNTIKRVLITIPSELYVTIPSTRGPRLEVSRDIYGESIYICFSSKNKYVYQDGINYTP